MVFITGLTLYGGIWLYYYSSMQRANKESTQIAGKKNRKDAFSGIVTRIERFEDDSFMEGRYFVITIEPTDSLKKTLNYQYNLPENKSLMEFVKVGQTASKSINIDKFHLSDKQKGTRRFWIANVI